MNDKRKSHGWKTLQVKIHGMHCANCEVLIERRFKKIPGVRKVTARCSTGTAEIVYYGELDQNTLQSSIKDDGYTVSGWLEQKSSPEHKNTGRDYLEIGTAFLILVGLYVILKQFGILPESFAVTNTTISFGLAFLIGLVASMSTCIAVTGGLLVAIAAKYNAASGNLSGAQKFKPHIFFNVGRIVSYTILGGAIGALGSTLTLSAETSSILILLASVVMIALGLQMLNLFPRIGLFRLPKFIGHWIHDYTDRKAKGSAFTLGALTFFLPCGFTQGLQLYVLAKGSFAIGALTMFAFALGTLPALLSLSALSSFAAGGFQRYFLKLAGAAVVVLGIFNVQSGLTLAETTEIFPSTPANSQQPSEVRVQTAEARAQTQEARVKTVPVVDGKQIVNMKIDGFDYVPNHFTVKEGIPVEWRIDASKAVGCGRILIAPKAGVRKLLPFGTSVITFTPQEPGEIRFNCSMGMMTPGSKIIVLANAKGKLTEDTPVGPPGPPVQAQSQAPAQTQAQSQPQSQAQAQSQSQTLSRGQPPSVDQREIERILVEYLRNHPEVVQEALAVLEKRQEAAEAEQRKAAVKEHSAALLSSPRHVVLGNPKGDVTMIEFFDYNCSYCKRALSDTLDLLKNDPNLRVVLKEFPILGQTSVEAAQVAIAVRMQDGTGKKYLEFHQKLLGGRGPADRARALAVAKEIGLDMAKLETDIANPEVKATIDENLGLAQAIGLTGTPTYVIGSDVVIGAVGIETLRAKLKLAREQEPRSATR